MTQHIIFDLDGTLVDSKQEVLDTFKQVCEKLPPSDPLDLNSISLTATLQATLEIIYKGDAKKITEAKNIFSEVYDNSTFEKTLLYPHVYETLKQLHNNNYILHIATNKRLAPTLKILAQKQLSNFITSVKASDQTKGKITSKEEMVRQICAENNIKEGIMVGDGQKDIEAGKVCGLITVAITYGYEKKEDLIKKNPKFAIHSILELMRVISN
ncbi:MAG: HAD family hydrolase [Bacteroidetes bacterium]|nr:HAD family hydrolase [Bacteroidota bacterium]